MIEDDYVKQITLPVSYFNYEVQVTLNIKDISGMVFYH